MGLKPGSGGNSTGMVGVFINRDPIVDVQDVTGMGQFASDVALKLLFPEKTTKAGATFQPSMIVYGDFVKDGQGLITGWGSAFKIDRLINHIGKWNGELQSREIPTEALNALIGKEVFHLQYCAGLTDDGKRKMRDYQILANPMEGNEAGDAWLLKSFQKQVEGGKSKYDPDAYERSGNGNGSVATSSDSTVGEL